MEEIGKILPQILKPQLARLEPPVVEVLAPLWGQVVGKALAKECRPTAFHDGVLTLATDDGDWARPLRQMADEIRMHVNKYLGRPLVKNIRVVCAANARGGGSSRQPAEAFLAGTGLRFLPIRDLAIPSKIPPASTPSRAGCSVPKRRKVH